MCRGEKVSAQNRKKVYILCNFSDAGNAAYCYDVPIAKPWTAYDRPQNAWHGTENTGGFYYG